MPLEDTLFVKRKSRKTLNSLAASISCWRRCARRLGVERFSRGSRTTFNAFDSAPKPSETRLRIKNTQTANRLSRMQPMVGTSRIRKVKPQSQKLALDAGN